MMVCGGKKSGRVSTRSTVNTSASRRLSTLGTCEVLGQIRLLMHSIPGMTLPVIHWAALSPRQSNNSCH